MTTSCRVRTDTGVHAATEQVELIDERTYRCGELISTADPAPEGTALSAALHRAVYSRLYLGLQRDASDPADRRLATAREDAAFVATLRTAEGGRQRWEGGWRMDASGTGWVAVRSLHDGVQVRCHPAQVMPNGAGPGDEVQVAFPTERRFVSPAFYLTVGLAGNGTGRAVPDVLRWYLNVPADGAAALLQTLVEHLDAGGIPFTVKTLNDPAQHPRPDAMVLYTDRARTPAVAPVVRMSLEQTGVVLRDAVPAFTRRLASGVAIADEPARERRTLSFGQHRSLLVVRGILAAGVGADLQTRWTAVDAEFRRAGLDPERPHLGSGNAEVAVQEPGWRA